MMEPGSGEYMALFQFRTAQFGIRGILGHICNAYV